MTTNKIKLNMVKRIFLFGFLGSLGFFLAYIWIMSRQFEKLNLLSGIIPAFLISIIIGLMASALPKLKARNDIGGNVLFIVLIIVAMIVLYFTMIGIGINLAT
ncbi:MAG: hypothetical protein O2779_04575 [Nanoarchaeota archaeon]|nr:hypothetical protein [Nanoarchaeota archaeon]